MQEISVVVPTYNRPESLNDALLSLAEQTFGAFKVLVINDAGEDVKAIVDRWRGALDVSLFSQSSNKGISATRNWGLDLAKTPFVAFLDDDDVFLPSHLKAVYDVLNGGNNFVYSGAVVSTVRVRPPILEPKTVPPYAYFAYPYTPGFMSIMNYLPTSTVAIRVNERRFDERISVVEDWRFWLDLMSEPSYTPCFTGQITVVYHRIAYGDNITSDVSSAARWTDTYRLIWSEYPDSRRLIEKYRSRVLDFLSSVEASVNDKLEIDHFRYEQCLARLHGDYTEELYSQSREPSAGKA